MCFSVNFVSGGNRVFLVDYFGLNLNKSNVNGALNSVKTNFQQLLRARAFSRIKFSSSFWQKSMFFGGHSAFFGDS